jgi:hypothetical protein
MASVNAAMVENDRQIHPSRMDNPRMNDPCWYLSAAPRGVLKPEVEAEKYLKMKPQKLWV